jgi:primosomal protein N'
VKPIGEVLMARVHEEELVCPVCEKTARIPFCCGKVMEQDKREFFCPTCGKETSMPACCGQPMNVRKTVLDIKKELFGGI